MKTKLTMKGGPPSKTKRENMMIQTKRFVHKNSGDDGVMQDAHLHHMAMELCEFEIAQLCNLGIFVHVLSCCEFLLLSASREKIVSPSM
mmetsp:Transcript_21918/g.35276  ORF Transcript_21918/g.35276 Transcript_21918/m.35276 type:complete len:89 (+) Transcript_21918:2361-2627(+)|eukprot:jgi/Bigna1/85248/estExt_fgenesh1_pg.C_30059